ncbi:MAG TPA: tail fiber domain-containing protein, partial [Candidatus Paceibacterota bacterium]
DDSDTMASSSAGTLLTLSQTGAGNILSLQNTTGAVFTVTNDGNLGISTTSPYAALSVVGASGVVADKYFATNTNATSTFAGAMSIGTTTSSTTLYVQGSVQFASLPSGPFAEGAENVCIDPQGRLLSATAAGTCAASSQRFKNNIEGLNVGLDTLLKLRPTQYYYTNRQDWGQMMGFIAEEVDTIDPRLAFRLPDGTVQGVRYDIMTSLITKSVQELNTKLDTAISGGEIKVGSSFWMTDEMGRIEAPGDVNFAGHKLVNVGSIESLSGKWSIDESGRLTAKELCLEDVCVGKTELKALLDNAGISPTQTPPLPTDTPPADSPPTTDTPPTDQPPTDTPPADEPPTDTPPADTPPAPEPPADTSPPPADNPPPTDTP